ncbi:MAG TPA: hypothetical protein VMV10_26135 [Pirellulales bacterium]|nr:hypothetical protein [Pirellulales bacterium]
MNAMPSGSLSRRNVLQVGCSAFAGLSLPAVLAGRAKAATSSAPARRPKSVILVLLTGGAAHQDTFDLKPEAPDAVRSEFKRNRSRPGVAGAKTALRA